MDNIPLPEGNYVLVDLGDMFEQYMNLDPAIRNCEPLANTEMSPEDAFEVEVCGLFPLLGNKGLEDYSCREYGDQLEDQANELPAWKENGDPLPPRVATPEEEELISKYAKAMTELGLVLHEKTKHLDLHDPVEGIIELEFHSVVRNRFMLLANPN